MINFSNLANFAASPCSSMDRIDPSLGLDVGSIPTKGTGKNGESMLKPRRKIIKKELKKDPYIEFLAKAKNNVDENKTLYMRWALGAVAV